MSSFSEPSSIVLFVGAVCILLFIMHGLWSSGKPQNRKLKKNNQQDQEIRKSSQVGKVRIVTPDVPNQGADDEEIDIRNVGKINKEGAVKRASLSRSTLDDEFKDFQSSASVTVNSKKRAQKNDFGIEEVNINDLNNLSPNGLNQNNGMNQGLNMQGQGNFNGQQGFMQNGMQNNMQPMQGNIMQGSMYQNGMNPNANGMNGLNNMSQLNGDMNNMAMQQGQLNQMGANGLNDGQGLNGINYDNTTSFNQGANMNGQMGQNFNASANGFNGNMNMTQNNGQMPEMQPGKVREMYEMILTADPNRPYAGEEIEAICNQYGFIQGFVQDNLKIYCVYENAPDKTNEVFRICSMEEPYYFPEVMQGFKTSAIALYMNLPPRGKGFAYFKALRMATEIFLNQLGGRIQDTNRNNLDANALDMMALELQQYDNEVPPLS